MALSKVQSDSILLASKQYENIDELPDDKFLTIANEIISNLLHYDNTPLESVEEEEIEEDNDNNSVEATEPGEVLDAEKVSPNLGKNHLSMEEKIAIIQLQANGLKLSEISRKLRRAYSSVHDFFRRWIEEQLFKCLQEAWKSLDKGLLQRLVDSMPDRCRAVIAANGNPTKY